eukprot:3176699-Pyramimonas_sp.AAC.1
MAHIVGVAHTLPAARNLRSQSDTNSRRQITVTKCTSAAIARAQGGRACVPNHRGGRGVGVMGFTHAGRERARKSLSFVSTGGACDRAFHATTSV